MKTIEERLIELDNNIAVQKKYLQIADIIIEIIKDLDREVFSKKFNELLEERVTQEVDNDRYSFEVKVSWWSKKLEIEVCLEGMNILKDCFIFSFDFETCFIPLSTTTEKIKAEEFISVCEKAKEKIEKSISNFERTKEEYKSAIDEFSQIVKQLKEFNEKYTIETKELFGLCYHLDYMGETEYENDF